MTKTPYLDKTAKTVVCIAIVLFLGMILGVQIRKGQNRLKVVGETIPLVPL
jgi:hypothetical protein